MSLRVVGIYPEALISHIDTMQMYITCDGALQEYCGVLLSVRSARSRRCSETCSVRSRTSGFQQTTWGATRKTISAGFSVLACLVCEGWNRLLWWLRDVAYLCLSSSEEPLLPQVRRP